MNGFSFRLRQLGNKLKTGLYRFMAGRYGTDKLNTVILWTGVILMLISMFLEGWGYFILWLLSYVCMGWALYRAFSRQTVYLVHKWLAEGMPLPMVARILNRSEENVRAAAEVPLLKGEKALMRRYFAPFRMRKETE